MAFVRLRSNAQEIAVIDGGKAELLNVEDHLWMVLRNQLRLIMWRWALDTCIKVTLFLVLNFYCNLMFELL